MTNAQATKYFSFLTDLDGFLGCRKCSLMHKRVSECEFTMSFGPKRKELSVDDIELDIP